MFRLQGHYPERRRRKFFRGSGGVLPGKNLKIWASRISRNAFKSDNCKKMVMNLYKVTCVINSRHSTFSLCINQFLQGLLKTKLFGGHLTPSPSPQTPRSLQRNGISLPLSTSVLKLKQYSFNEDSRQTEEIRWRCFIWHRKGSVVNITSAQWWNIALMLACFSLISMEHAHFDIFLFVQTMTEKN